VLLNYYGQGREADLTTEQRM